MTDKEIIKALECCVNGTTSGACHGCRFNTKEGCIAHVCIVESLAFDLIKRQQEEIEKWQSGYMTQKQEIANLEIEFKAMRGAAKSFKEEVKRLKAEKDKLFDEVWECRQEHWNDFEIKCRAVKEFAERLCEGRVSNDPVAIAVKVELDEMVGEE